MHNSSDRCRIVLAGDEPEEGIFAAVDRGGARNRGSSYVAPRAGNVPVPLDVVTRWIELCRKHPVKGAGIYDLQIVAAMLANGVHRIATFDAADFQAFAEIEVEIPTV